MESTVKGRGRSWLVWTILSLATALISSVGIWWRDFWYELLPPRMWLVDLAGDVWVPLWLLTTCMAFIRFPAPRKRLWWLLLPAPLPLLPVLQFLFVILTWGTHGFAP